MPEIYSEERIVETVPLLQPVLEQVCHKWSILVLAFLCEEPKRFNDLKRRASGITQRALTDTLRRLERNGLISRRVSPSPIAVTYSITPLGRTLQPPFMSMYEWALDHRAEIADAHRLFDTPAPSAPA